jgi:hypothetical protein
MFHIFVFLSFLFSLISWNCDFFRPRHVSVGRIRRGARRCEVSTAIATVTTARYIVFAITCDLVETTLRGEADGLKEFVIAATHRVKTRSVAM